MGSGEFFKALIAPSPVGFDQSRAGCRLKAARQIGGPLTGDAVRADRQSGAQPGSKLSPVGALGGSHDAILTNTQHWAFDVPCISEWRELLGHRQR
jgi:hypothetical protein